MTNSGEKTYDLHERTFQFAKKCRELIRTIPKSLENREDGKQLVRSSGSVAANYIEANESISKKDFLFRVKICRKEAKESHLWLKLIVQEEQSHSFELQQKLVQEALELAKIFGSIVNKASNNP
ncbi:MAG: four helix bundle protein [Candidatus Altimarinota bacterium]